MCKRKQKIRPTFVRNTRLFEINFGFIDSEKLPIYEVSK